MVTTKSKKIHNNNTSADENHLCGASLCKSNKISLKATGMHAHMGLVPQ